MAKASRLEKSPIPLEELLGRGEPLRGLRFEDAELFAFSLTGEVFDGCEFKSCVFDQAKLKSCRFVNCRFAHCDIREAKFTGCKFTDGDESTACVWYVCAFSESAFDNCNLSLNVFDKCKAPLTEFRQCSAMGLTFNAEVHRKIGGRSLLGGVKFEDCKMQYALFREQDFSGSAFAKCDLRDASFEKSNLTGASFAASAIHNINLRKAILDRCTLSHATFDKFNLDDPASFSGMIVSADHQATILRSMGILVAG